MTRIGTAVWTLFGITLLSHTTQAQIVYDFEGQCGFGCTGTARGVLTLAETLDGIPGTADFVSFEFESSQGSYSIPGGNDLLVVNEFVGSPLPATSGTAVLFLDWVGPRSYFVTDTVVFNSFLSGFQDATWAARLVDGAVIEGGSSYSWTLRSDPPTVEEQLLTLIEDVFALDLGAGPTRSFTTKLDSAFNAIGRAGAGGPRAAINKLNAFINSVQAQRGKALSAEDADNLTMAAMDIIAALGG